jgi:hypothetical protein
VLLNRCGLIALVPYLRLFVSKRSRVSLKSIAVLSRFLISVYTVTRFDHSYSSVRRLGRCRVTRGSFVITVTR